MEELIGVEVLQDPQYKDVNCRRELARKPNLIPELVEALTTDESSMVRCYTAMRDDLTPEQIDRLTKDKSEWVRVDTARRPDLDSEQVERLSRDEDWGVRWEIARRGDLTVEQIKRLSKDKDRDVRRTIKQNPLYKGLQKQTVKQSNEKGVEPKKKGELKL